MSHRDPQWQAVIRLGEELLETGSLAEQRKRILEAAPLLLGGKTRLWLDESRFRLPGRNQEPLFPLRPPTAQMKKALETGEICCLPQAATRLALPLKGRRKLTFENLENFLRRTGGGWFKLLDFEAHFQVNKNTAWSYLNLLLTEGILEHNGAKANRVRYAMAPSFRAPGCAAV